MAGIWFPSFVMVCICLLFSKNSENFRGYIMAALGFPIEVFQLLAMRGRKASTHAFLKFGCNGLEEDTLGGRYRAVAQTSTVSVTVAMLHFCCAHLCMSCMFMAHLNFHT